MVFTNANFKRVAAPPEIHHERLFVVSVLGFFVNLIGIFVFQHGGEHASHHGHSHGGGGGGCGSHGHSHSLFKSSTSSLASSSTSSLSHAGGGSHPGSGYSSHDDEPHGHSHHGHSHDYHGHSHDDHGHSHDDHGHSHDDHGHAGPEGNKIFEGVFLHILADTLGLHAFCLHNFMNYF